MKSITRLLINLFFLVLAAGLSSCGDDFALKKEKHYVEEEHKNWLTDDSPGAVFIMQDNNGISSEFKMFSSSSSMRQSESAVLFIPTKKTYFESFSQVYHSSFNKNFSVSLYAYTDYDEIRVQLGKVYFAWHFETKRIDRLGVKDESIFTIYDDPSQDPGIHSTVEFLDSLLVNNTLYTDVMHFKLADLEEEWKDKTVTEFYIAKHYGLIKYALANGLTYERQQ